MPIVKPKTCGTGMTFGPPHPRERPLRHIPTFVTTTSEPSGEVATPPTPLQSPVGKSPVTG